jgi:15-cis-phytoene synthase
MITLRPIIFAYAPSKARSDLSALFDLDEALGRILASTTEPMIGQMRLTWWHERLAALGSERVPAEPVLGAISDMAERGVATGEALAAMVEGWEALLEPLPLDNQALETFAKQRGDVLFTMAAQICGRSVPHGMGAGWALIDFAMHCSDERTAANAVVLARRYLTDVKISGPKSLRILAHVARDKAIGAAEHVHRPIRRRTILKAVLR